MKSFKLKIVSIFLLILVFASCKKSFLDVNQNPNDPSSADKKLVLPNVQAYTAYIMGNYMQLWGGIWGQYWTQSPDASQYKDWDRYIQTNADMNRAWTQLYGGVISDADALEQQAKAEGAHNWHAIALILKAYAFQVATDAWGNVPFSQALKGNGNLQPNFDNQKDVYAGIEKMLIEAANMIDVNSDVHPGAEDLYFAGDMEHWLEFANSLRLRVYMRQAYTTEAARCKDSVTAMIARGDLFLSADVKVGFAGTQFQSNPLNTTQNALYIGNLLASSSIVDSLKSLADPRLAMWFNKPTAGTAQNQATYVGFKQGLAFTYQLPATESYKNWSTPSPAVGGAAKANLGKDAPVYLMSMAEVEFLLAEAGARGWNGSDDGKADYIAAINASFAQWGAGAATTYLTDARVDYTKATTPAKKLEYILTQKWYALCGSQNFEGWTEHRRTGFPMFITPSMSSQLPAGEFPTRFVLASDELTRNPNASRTSDNPSNNVNTKVWWDKN